MFCLLEVESEPDERHRQTCCAGSSITTHNVLYVEQRGGLVTFLSG